MLPALHNNILIYSILFLKSNDIYRKEKNTQIVQPNNKLNFGAVVERT